MACLRSVRWTVPLSALGAALALAAIPFPARWVERLFSNGLYPWLPRLCAPLTSALPFPLLDLWLLLLLFGCPLWWAVRFRRFGPGRRWQAAGQAALDTLLVAATLACAFELLWGLNYQRRPLTAKLDWDQQRVNFQSATNLSWSAIEHLNTEAAVARTGPWPPEEEWRAALHESFIKVVTGLGQQTSLPAVKPKTSLLDTYMAVTRVDGFVNPFGYEVILNSQTLPFERPYLLAHEWAHLAGFADESEASFVGVLACLRSDLPGIRYSGWLSLHFNLPGPNPRSTNSWPRLAPQVLNDIRAIQGRYTQHRGQVSQAMAKAQSKVYDRFLKVNRVRAGIGSYDLLARLILGTRFEGDWTPALRPD